MKIPSLSQLVARYYEWKIKRIIAKDPVMKALDERIAAARKAKGRVQYLLNAKKTRMNDLLAGKRK